MNELCKIRLLNRESGDEQISVYQQVFNSQESFEETKKHWEEKHFCNPMHDSFVFGAFYGGRLVCINVFMPQLYFYKNFTLNAIQSCESATLSEYRGRGIWSSVIEYAINYFKKNTCYVFIFGFPNYDNSYEGFLKLGWKKVAEVRNLIMIGNSAKFLKIVAKNQLIGINHVLSLQHVFLKMFSKNNKFSLEKGDINKRMIYKKENNISLNINKSLIQWKMKYRNLKIVNVFLQKKLVATCYYSIANYKKEKVIWLFDVCVLPDISIDEVKEINATCVYALLKLYKNIAFIRTWIMDGNKNYALYKKLLFIKSSHHNPFIMYPLNLKHMNGNILFNPKLWDNISFINLD